MRTMVGAIVWAALAASPARQIPQRAMTTAVLDGPACPLAVQQLRREGLSVAMVLRNTAPYAVDQLVVQVTYRDVLRQSHRQGYRINLTVPQHETMVYTTPPITGTPVVWPTLVVSTACHMVRH